MKKRVKSVDTIVDLTNCYLYLPSIIYIKEENKHICIPEISNYSYLNPVYTTITNNNILRNIVDSDNLEYTIINTFDTGKYNNILFE